MTTKLNLCIYAGDKRVERHQIDDTPLPAATKSYQPISNSYLANLVETRLDQLNLEIVDQTHAISKNRQMYFGMYQVHKPNISEDYDMVIGIRNSHNKAISAGLVAGSGVFVCSNLAFAGDIQLSRRHGNKIQQFLPGIVDSGMDKLMDIYLGIAARFQAYQDTPTESDAKVAQTIIELSNNGIISSQSIPVVYNEWMNPSHDEFKPRNNYSLFNCVTETLKGKEINAFNTTTQQLHKYFDKVSNYQPTVSV